MNCNSSEKDIFFLAKHNYHFNWYYKITMLRLSFVIELRRICKKNPGHYNYNQRQLLALEKKNRGLEKQKQKHGCTKAV